MIESYQLGRCTIEIHQDEDCSSPRKDDNFGIMVNWHSRYNLGDVQGREKYGSGEAFLRYLANPFAPPGRDFENSEMEKVLRVVDRHYVILPLGLYDHSGISIFTGGPGDLAWDSVGWDTSDIGYIYASLEDARKNWVLPKARWSTKIKTKVCRELRGKREWIDAVIPLREAAENLLRFEVEYYDEYLTGQCYGYVVKAENGEEDSCWGFVGDMDYVKSEAEDAAKHLNEKMQEEDTVAEITERETELAEVWP